MQLLVSGSLPRRLGRMAMSGCGAFHVDQYELSIDTDLGLARSSFFGEGGYIIHLGDRNLELKLLVSVVSDEKNFNVKIVRQIFEQNKLVKERRWEASLPREFQ